MALETFLIENVARLLVQPSEVWNTRRETCEVERHALSASLLMKGMKERGVAALQ